MPPTLATRKIGGTDVSAIGYGAMGIAAFYGTVENDEERFKVRPRRARAASARLPDHDAQILDAVYESGCTLWDTADVYNDSEELLGKWCVCTLFPLIPSSFTRRFKRTGKRSEIFLATKFAFTPWDKSRPVNGDPAYVKSAFEKSLGRLGGMLYTLVEGAMLTFVQSTTSTCTTCTGASVPVFSAHICLSICRPDPTVPIETTVRAMVELVQSACPILVSTLLG
jgi:aryl-alcohol dehydrogenase-like predicted oxidoreductase